MAENELSSQEKAQLDQLVAEVNAGQPEAISLGDICTLWNKYKVFWPAIIKAARLIPVYGAAIATVLEWIGKALDAFCSSKK